MNREEWLQARRRGIGGSDAAAVLGLSPWKSNVRLWEEKTGLLGEALCSVEIPQAACVKWRE